uniref:TIGR00282 family metallophosphoesterase n=1 Tax=mine drainage metagenome TaxID=410659 RepID=E6PIR3_9ZZZZ
MNVLVIGDIVGSPGRDAVKRYVSVLRDQYEIDACIANGENIAAGFGLTAATCEELFESGVDFLTGGNHTFDKRDFKAFLERSDRVIRPANYPPGTPGAGAGTMRVGDVTLGIINVMGRTFMPPVDDPFRALEAEITAMRAVTPCILVDVHAEATSEKQGLARFADGKVSAIYGTHTHVQTADEEILPGGTAYITDLGMTGPSDGIIGMESEAVLSRFLTGFSDRFSVCKSGTKQLCAAVLCLDTRSGRAISIKRIFQRGIP